MIIGIGNDLVDIRRIEGLLGRSGKRFIERCFTEEECAKAGKHNTKEGRSGAYAKRYAAKEACAKAMGLGFAGGVEMRDVGVRSDENGRPFLELEQGALKRLEDITPKDKIAQLHLSLSDEYPYAQAFVIIEAV